MRLFKRKRTELQKIDDELERLESQFTRRKKKEKPISRVEYYLGHKIN